ncbi:MAG: hypothetical protein GMKNLPBB_01708 [Myxococcota bacterium]|nr:hypothetical protein [Myxococcota bacterium]
MNEPQPMVLHFISGKYRGGQFPIQPGQEIVIGRSSDLDMVLVEDMVSRKHSKISYLPDGIYIQDLGSTNGTFVNGERIKRTKLKEGDRILVGTSILKLEKDGFEPSPESEAARQGRRPRSGQSTMAGSLEEIPLPDLMQLFSTSRKSGVLVINNQDTKGKIHFREGRIVYASINDNHDLGPQKAIYRMIAWDKGFFELQAPTDEEFMIELDEPVESLLMEGMRLKDEIGRYKDHVPGLSARLKVNLPLGAPLRALEPALLDMFQHVLNDGRVESILNESPESDLETVRLLSELVKKKYIVVD